MKGSIMDMDEIINKLEVYAEADSTESAEYWWALANMWRYVDHSISSRFRIALENEIRDTFTWIEKNYRLEEREETQTLTFKELVFIDEWHEDIT